MTVTYSENDATRTAEIKVSGRITDQDYQEAVTPLQAFIDKHGTIKLIEILESFEGFEASVIWQGIKFDIKNLKHISHVAVVSDIGWVSPLTKAAGAFMSTKLRTFDLDQVDAARDWLASA